MSTLLDRRAQGCSRAMGRLFRGAAMPGLPTAWRELMLDPSATSEARWEAALGAMALDREDAAPSEAASRAVERVQSAWARPVRNSESTAPARASVGRPGVQMPDVRDVPGGWPGLPDPAHRSRAMMGSDAGRLARDIARPSTHPPGSAPAALSSRPPPMRPVGVQSTTEDPARRAPSVTATETRAGPPADGASSANPETGPSAPATRLVQSAEGLGRLLSLVPRAVPPPAPRRAGTAEPSWPPAAPVARGGSMAPAVPAAHRPSPAGLGGLAPPAALPSRFEPPPAPAPAVDIDEVLEALAERLRLDYLRHYGSASG